MAKVESVAKVSSAVVFDFVSKVTRSGLLPIHLRLFSGHNPNEDWIAQAYWVGKQYKYDDKEFDANVSIDSIRMRKTRITPSGSHNMLFRLFGSYQRTQRKFRELSSTL